jgi:hypothetical protein
LILHGGGDVLRYILRTGLLVLALLVVTSVLGAVAASACNSGWSRSPDDGDHYFAGIWDLSPPHVVNGVNANIYATAPTTPASTYGNLSAFSSAWVGLNAPDQSSGALMQEGFVRQRGNGGVDCTIYEIIGGSGNIVWGHDCGQNLTVGNTYNFNVYYNKSDDTARFDFAGIEKWAVVMSSVGETIQGDATFIPQVTGETGSYNQQMPGTSGNTEFFSQLQERHGTTWDSTGDQNWTTVRSAVTPAGHPAHVSQTRINNSFEADYLTGSPPIAQEYDNCTSS